MKQRNGRSTRKIQLVQTRYVAGGEFSAILIFLAAAVVIPTPRESVIKVIFQRRQTPPNNVLDFLRPS